MITQIVQSPLTQRWYVVTRYSRREGGVIVAATKHDVTDQMEPILKRYGAKPQKAGKD